MLQKIMFIMLPTGGGSSGGNVYNNIVTKYENSLADDGKESQP